VTGYTKLFGSILDSTVWKLPLPSKVVWVTMMAMQDRDGVVEASIPGLADRAGVTVEQCETALLSFLSPDRYSRTRDHDGRRIEETIGGWRLLNSESYRQRMSAEDRKERAAERQRRYAANKKERQQASANVSKRQNDDNQKQKQIQKQEEEKDPSAAPPVVSEPPAAFLKFWNSITSPRRKGERAEALEAWKKAGKPEADYLIGQWEAYLASLGETFPKDVCRWLKKGIFRGPFEGKGKPKRAPQKPIPFLPTLEAPAPWTEEQKLEAAELTKRLAEQKAAP
jgi:hypothetical protein